jgi:AraC-like DNA-binding protein
LDEPNVTRRPLADAAHHVRRSDGLVARAFRAENGVSIDWYRRRRQIDRAWTLLADPARKLSDIAATSGFADQSHMTRVFVREIGETPARLRQQMLHVASARHWFRTVPVTAIGQGA